MAHALFEYDGICRNIHGHTYGLEITLIGKVRQKPGSPKDGMVIDFHDLKMLVDEHIINKLDHALMINNMVSAEYTKVMKNLSERVYFVDFQPTTENIVLHIAQILSPLLPEDVSLHSVRLYETPSSFAEWFSSDNPKILE